MYVFRSMHLKKNNAAYAFPPPKAPKMPFPLLLVASIIQLMHFPVVELQRLVPLHIISKSLIICWYNLFLAQFIKDIGNSNIDLIVFSKKHAINQIYVKCSPCWFYINLGGPIYKYVYNYKFCMWLWLITETCAINLSKCFIWFTAIIKT